MLKMMMVATVLGSLFALTACQSAQVYNGVSGYQVQSKNAQSAVLSYTLSARNAQVNQAKLQGACQQVLGKHKQYQIDILSQQEIVNPQTSREVEHGVSFKEGSNIYFGFSNSPSLHDSQGYATRQALDVQPKMLSVISYRCS